MKLKLLALLVSLLSLFLLSACTIGGVEIDEIDNILEEEEEEKEKSMTPIEFNDHLIDLQEQPLDAAEDFGSIVGESLVMGEVDEEGLNAAYDKVVEDFDKSYTDLSDVEVPDYTGAQLFYDAMMDFMDVEKNRIVGEYFSDIRDVMLDSALTTDEKDEQVNTLFDELSPIENEALENLQEAQEEFANANDFGLK